MKNIIIFILFFISFNAYSQKTIITEFKLKNGYTVRGTIIDSIPNKSYTIKTPKGVEQSYSFDEIEKISKITFGKDKDYYIPKGKFSINTEFGYMAANRNDYGSESLSDKLFSISINYNIFNNLETSLIYGISNYRYDYNYDNGYYDVSVKQFENRYGISLKKYFTKSQIRPFVGIDFVYCQAKLDGAEKGYFNWFNIIEQSRGYSILMPNVGIIFFLNSKLSIFSSYKPSINLSDHTYTQWNKPGLRDGFKNGFYILGLKYTFRK